MLYNNNVFTFLRQKLHQLDTINLLGFISPKPIIICKPSFPHNFKPFSNIYAAGLSSPVVFAFITASDFFTSYPCLSSNNAMHSVRLNKILYAYHDHFYCPCFLALNLLLTKVLMVSSESSNLCWDLVDRRHSTVSSDFTCTDTAVQASSTAHRTRQAPVEGTKHD